MGVSSIQRISLLLESSVPPFTHVLAWLRLGNWTGRWLLTDSCAFWRLVIPKCAKEVVFCRFALAVAHTIRKDNSNTYSSPGMIHYLGNAAGEVAYLKCVHIAIASLVEG